MSAVKILIVENELLVSENIAARLKEYGYEVTGQARTAKEAITMFNEQHPDLIIMDISLDGGTDGIEVAEMIKKQQFLPVIFLTNLDDPLTTKRAANVGPAAYLLKPFNERQLVVSIHQALYNLSNDKIADPADTSVPSQEQYIMNNAFFLRIDARHYKKITLDDILYIVADGSYCDINTTDTVIKYTTSMNQVLQKINHPSFTRVSRSYVVNLTKVNEIKGNLLLIGNTEILIGESYRDDLMKMFPILK